MRSISNGSGACVDTCHASCNRDDGVLAQSCSTARLKGGRPNMYEVDMVGVRLTPSPPLCHAAHSAGPDALYISFFPL